LAQWAVEAEAAAEAGVEAAVVVAGIPGPPRELIPLP
jgi:hypothetical protein